MLKIKFCGLKKDFVILTEENVIIEFKTDSTKSNFPGFKVHYSEIDELSNERQFYIIIFGWLLAGIVVLIALSAVICCIVNFKKKSMNSSEDPSWYQNDFVAYINPQGYNLSSITTLTRRPPDYICTDSSNLNVAIPPNYNTIYRNG